MNTPEDIKSALDRAAALVEAKPAIGQRAYKSVAAVGDGLACLVEEKDWSLSADTPKSMGGDNSAPSPSTLFRASVSSCVAIGIKMWAARLRTPIKSTEAIFETDVDARGQFGVDDDVPAGFEQARLSICVISEASEHDVLAVVEASLRYSPMMEVISGRFPIEIDISVNSSEELEGAAA